MKNKKKNTGIIFRYNYLRIDIIVKFIYSH